MPRFYARHAVTTRCGADWQRRNFVLGPWLLPPCALLKLAPTKADFCTRKVYLLRPELFYPHLLAEVCDDGACAAAKRVLGL